MEHYSIKKFGSIMGRMNPDPTSSAHPAPAAAARLPVALIGGGQIGRMHAERAVAHPDVRFCGVADPSPATRDWAAAYGIPWFADAASLLDATKPGAALVATPNALHRDAALACIDRGVPVLVEKPVADTLQAGLDIVRAAARAGVPVLVGHQRRHNPIAREARRLVQAGVLGRPVAANVLAAWLKPDPYFNAAWRREKGGGPVLINLIHDVDLLRFLLGDVVSVQAQSSSAVRGFAVEDTAAAVMRFANGALATLLTTDTATTPWNWDLAAGEAAHYPRQDIDSHTLMGTEGSLTLPRLAVWRYPGARGWHEMLAVTRSVPHTADPYTEQLRHLRAVAEGRETPLCSGLDGLRTLQATLAVHESAQSGAPVALEPLQ
jgi:predicted dehydrogenase